MRTPSEREESASDDYEEWVVVVLLASARRSGAKGWHDGQRATEGCTTYIVCLNSSDEGMHAQRRSVDRPLGSAGVINRDGHRSECAEEAQRREYGYPLQEKEAADLESVCLLKSVCFLKSSKMVVLRSAQRMFTSPGPWPLIIFY